MSWNSLVVRRLALVAACLLGTVGLAHASDAPASAGDGVRKPVVKKAKPLVQAGPDRLWFGLGAKGSIGADAGAGAQVALNYLRSDGSFFRLQHHALLVDERGPDVGNSDDCFFLECFFDAFGAFFEPISGLGTVSETGILLGRRMAPDSGWFAAIGVARQAYSDSRKTDSRDDVGVGVPVLLGWSTALKHSGVGFEFDLSGSAGQVSDQFGMQLTLTFGGRVR